MESEIKKMVNKKIKIPARLVKKLDDAGIASRSYARREAETLQEIKRINKRFFANVTSRIRHRLKGIDYRIVDCGIFRSGQPFGLVKISVFLGHPNKSISLSCYIKEYKDIEPMCAEAKAMVKAFNELQEIE